MPIMYILGTVFFTTSYLNYKWLFFYWYQTSHGFNEDVALYSINFMKWGVLFHMAMSVFIYSNKRVLTPVGYTTEMHFRPKGEPPRHFF